MCSSLYHQSILETSPPLSNAIQFYGLKIEPNIQLRKEIRSENQVFDAEDNYSSKRPSFYRQSSLKYSPQLSHAVRYYDLKSKSNMQL